MAMPVAMVKSFVLFTMMLMDFFMEVRLTISFLFRIIFISLFNDFNFTIIHLVTDFDIISLILFDLIYEGIVLKFSIIVRLIVVRWLAFVRIYENWFFDDNFFVYNNWLFDNDFLLNNHWFLDHNLFVNDNWFFHFKFFLNDNWIIDNNLFVNNNGFYNMFVKFQVSTMAMV